MPSVEHVEKHFTATAAVRDIVIGMSDGLTVPFALAAGLTGAAISTNIVVTAGLAEIAAGSIAMGLGGYLAAKTDSEHYASELDREYRETVELPEVETEEVAKVFRDYGLSQAQMEPIVAAITADKKRWVDFMMRFELGLEEPDPARANRSAITQLLRDISHELRSPLARMRVAVGLARQPPADLPRQLDRLEREIERLDSLISQVLKLARLHGSEAPLERAAFDVDEVIEEVVRDANFEGAVAVEAWPRR